MAASINADDVIDICEADAVMASTDAIAASAYNNNNNDNSDNNDDEVDDAITTTTTATTTATVTTTDNVNITSELNDNDDKLLKVSWTG